MPRHALQGAQDTTRAGRRADKFKPFPVTRQDQLADVLGCGKLHATSLRCKLAPLIYD